MLLMMFFIIIIIQKHIYIYIYIYKCIDIRTTECTARKIYRFVDTYMHLCIDNNVIPLFFIH